MIIRSTKHFTTLREILHIVDIHDLLKLYGLVVKYYKNHLVAGAELVLWGDLQVLMDSQTGGKGSLVWNHQSHWQIRSWRLYTLSNVHVLETVSGEVLYMFVDVPYPLSVKLMERILKYKLEINKDVVGNDMTTAEQLIRFIKNQIAAAQVSLVLIQCSLRLRINELWYQFPRYVVPTGKDNFIVSAGRPNMVPAGRTIVSPGSIIFGPGG
ncbi:hypothetical protein Tco_0579089 [Tanacetum coccineum]